MFNFDYITKEGIEVDQKFLTIHKKYLINKRKGAGIKHFIDSEAFIESQMIWMVFIKLLKNTIQKQK